MHKIIFLKERDMTPLSTYVYNYCQNNYDSCQNLTRLAN